jgi:RHS repeat-associated protein
MISPQQNPLCSYRYDPLDRLVSQAKPQESTLQRFYCKSRVTTEVQGTLHHSIVQHDEQLLAQQQRQDGVSDTMLLATDQQRSILHLLKPNHQRQPFTYSPYGYRQLGNGLLSLLGFNGERLDPVIGNYLLGNGNRAFNPVLMRFNSPDRLSPFGKGGLNSYAYCLGDPVNLYDPSGGFGIRVAANILRWRGRAAMMVAEQKKLAVEVAKTGRIEVFGRSYALKRGLAPLEAVRLSKKSHDLLMLGTHDRAKQGKFLHDLTTAKNQSQLVQAQTGVLAVGNERLKLLEYIQEYDPKYLLAYSEDRLRNVSNNIFDPNVRIGDRPSAKSALQYIQEQKSVINPNSEYFFAESRRIRSQNFIPLN